MEQTASEIIDDYGGTTAVARLLKLPVSTVHSWRTNGIPDARFDHLKLAAAAAGVVPKSAAVCGLCELAQADPKVSICTEADCPMHQSKAA